MSANTNVSAAGEVAYFYTRSSTTVASGNVGDQVSYAVKGGKKIDIALTTRYSIGAIIPHVNYATVSADLVADKVVQEGIEAANQLDVARLAVLVAGAEVKTYEYGLTAKQAIFKAAADFRVHNKSNALRPTGALASPDFFNELIEDTNLAVVFKDVVVPGYGRQITIPGLGFSVIECPDLTAGFIIIHSEGFHGPINIKSLVVTDGTAAGYPASALIAGEIGYGAKVLKKTDDLSLDSSTGYLVALYTEAESAS